MRLTVLGCHSPYPGALGATAGYLLQTATSNILIDCGSGVVSQLMRYLPIEKLDVLLLSHFHHDHMADLGVLQYAMLVHQSNGDSAKGFPIYAPNEPAEWAKHVAYKDVTSHYVIQEKEKIRLHDVDIQFFPTDHPILCYAMRIEHGGKSLVYGADSGPNTAWEKYAKGADLFICEGTYLDKHQPPAGVGHLKVRQAAEIARSLEVKQLMITHLYPAFSLEEVATEAKAFDIGDCHIARIGLQIEI